MKLSFPRPHCISRCDAEENAIEDTIFYRGEALRRGVVDLVVFLMHARLLSRKQFQLRALMQKAGKTAGLSDLYGPCCQLEAGLSVKHSFLLLLFLISRTQNKLLQFIIRVLNILNQ